MRQLYKNIAMAAIAICTITGNACAQNSTTSQDYNLLRAYEVLRDERDQDKALELLSDQLKETPDNAEALFLRFYILYGRNEYASALADLNRTIKFNKPDKTGLATSTLLWWKGDVYSEMMEYAQAVDCYKAAIEQARKDDKDSVADIMIGCASALYYMDRLDEADALYMQIRKEDNSNPEAMIGLARNMVKREEYRDAVAMLDKVEKYDDSYPEIYLYRMQANDKLGETDKAIDDALNCYENGNISGSQTVIKNILKHKNYGIAKTREKLKASENPSIWKFLLIGIYETCGEYENAIRLYDELEEDYGKDEYIYAHRADCYDELGLVDIALADIDKAIEMNDSGFNHSTKSDILRYAGRYEEAIAEIDKVIEEYPVLVYPYYAKGLCYELSGNDDKALEYYDLGIDMGKTYAYVFLVRGKLFLKRGEKEKAEKDFEQVLQIDTTARDGSCRHYALHFLGKDEEAEEWMKKIIDEEPYDSGHWYDMACLLSRMGRLDESVKALEKSLDMGYCSFEHIRHDNDMDAIRDREDFKALIEKYEQKLAERIEKIGLEHKAPHEER